MTTFKVDVHPLRSQTIPVLYGLRYDFIGIKSEQLVDSLNRALHKTVTDWCEKHKILEEAEDVTPRIIVPGAGGPSAAS